MLAGIPNPGVTNLEDPSIKWAEASENAHLAVIKVVGGQLELREFCGCRGDRDGAGRDGGLSAHALASSDSLFEEAIQLAAKAGRVLAHFIHLLHLCQDLALSHDQRVQPARHPARDQWHAVSRC